MHVTGVLKVGPVCWENHEEVDLEEKGEVDGQWACQSKLQEIRAKVKSWTSTNKKLGFEIYHVTRDITETDIIINVLGFAKN